MRSIPATDVQSVVTVQELADWLATDNTDPLLPVMGATATAMAIDYCQREFITRERTVTYNVWPVVGTVTRGLSGSNHMLSSQVKLPYAQAVAVLSVELSGEVTTDYALMKGAPDYLQFDTVETGSDVFTPAIVATYTAGYGTIDDVPQGIKSAVLMLASFLYSHRGGCDADHALKQSGAAMALNPYRMTMGLI